MPQSQPKEALPKEALPKEALPKEACNGVASCPVSCSQCPIPAKPEAPSTRPSREWRDWPSQRARQA